MHWERWKRNGTLIPKVVIGHDVERFWSKVNKTASCWLWTGSLYSAKGYGQFCVKHRSVLAHRYSYQLVHGEIPNGMHIDHVKTRGCTSKACVNPDHLESVSPRENTIRARNPSPLPLGVTKHGHKYQAQCTANGKNNHLGTFEMPEEAHKAYLNFRAKLQ